VPGLTGAIAESWAKRAEMQSADWRADPATEITVTAGCTGGLAATFLGLINPGDEVILFEPFYDSYRACVAMAGARTRFVQLRRGASGSFEFDESELRAAFSERTKAILVNTPHNPTGKVFSREELGLIADLCQEHDVIAVTDEVYEHLVFEPDEPHLSLALLPGMGERTVTLSSLGKTFSLTGWKIGWAIAPPHLTAGVRSAHQFLVFAIATPLQHAAGEAIRSGGGAIGEVVDHYRSARDYLVSALADIGFEVSAPAGTYFVMADHRPVSGRLGIETDVDLCRHLTREIGVAAIPPSAFYSNPADGRHLVRFAFCKRMETLERAVERLGKLRV
jgi:aspartate/methionine/tyrosine aminotransferase